MKLKQADSICRMLQYFFLSCVILLGFSGITGCGGGGDGTTEPDIAYTGLTTPAQITDANAELFAAGAFGAGRTGSAFSGTGAVENSGNGSINSFRTFRISQALTDAALQADFSSMPGPPYIGSSESGTDPGPCGGSVSYNFQYNDSTGAFSGTFTFTNYCDTGVTINGRTNVTGTIDIGTSTIENIRFEFKRLSDGVSTLSGNMGIDFTGSPIIVDIDAYLEDKATKTVYWASNYVMHLTRTGYYVDVEIISGDYYEPDYGYVTVETPTPFRVVDTDIWPYMGVMIVTGTGNTKARLTAVSNTQCQIDANLDGDDTYEWGPVTGNWEDL